MGALVHDYWLTHVGGNANNGAAHMRVLGFIEMRSGWCFKEKHVRGLAKVLAGGASSRDGSTIAPNLRELRPDID